MCLFCPVLHVQCGPVHCKCGGVETWTRTCMHALPHQKYLLPPLEIGSVLNIYTVYITKYSITQKCLTKNYRKR